MSLKRKQSPSGVEVSNKHTHTHTHNVYICKRLPLVRSLSRYRRDCSAFVWSSLSIQAHYCGSIQNSFGERNYYTRTHTHSKTTRDVCLYVYIVAWSRLHTFYIRTHTRMSDVIVLCVCCKALATRRAKMNICIYANDRRKTTIARGL